MSFNLRLFGRTSPPDARPNRSATEEFESDEALLEYFVRRSIQSGKGRRLIAPQLAADPFQPDHPVVELLARRTCRRLAGESGFGATLRRCAQWLRGRRAAGRALPRGGAPHDTVLLVNDSPTVICREEDGKEP